MAAKKKGHGHVGNETETLVAVFREEFGKLREDIAGANRRLDQIIENTGARWRDHEARLVALEEKAGINH